MSRNPFSSPTPSDPRSARTIRRIVDAAARMFGDEGYRGASMNAVAKAAGVSKSLLHYHFSSKEHLLLEAQRATFRQIHARFQDRFRRGDTGTGTALEALDALWDAVWDMRGWTPFMVETMSLAAQNAPIRDHVDAFLDETEPLLVESIRELFVNDQLVLPPERLARMVRTVLHGLVVELAYARNTDDLQVVDQTYQDLRALFARVVTTGPHREEDR